MTGAAGDLAGRFNALLPEAEAAVAGVQNEATGPRRVRFGFRALGDAREYVNRAYGTRDEPLTAVMDAALVAAVEKAEKADSDLQLLMRQTMVASPLAAMWLTVGVMNNLKNEVDIYPRMVILFNAVINLALTIGGVWNYWFGRKGLRAAGANITDTRARGAAEDGGGYLDSIEHVLRRNTPGSDIVACCTQSLQTWDSINTMIALFEMAMASYALYMELTTKGSAIDTVTEESTRMPFSNSVLLPLARLLPLWTAALRTCEEVANAKGINMLHEEMIKQESSTSVAIARNQRRSL